MRRIFELVLRGLAVALLAVLLWRHWPRSAPSSANPAPVALALANPQSDSTGDATAAELLRVLLRDPRAEAPRAHLSVPSLPTPASRAALGAGAAGGIAVAWTDSSRAAGLAVGATSTPGADERVVIAASGAPGALLLRDEGGVLDSLPVTGSTASLLVRRGAPFLHAVQRGSSAAVAMPAPVARKRLLLYGRPGWETKFTVAALEEAGWAVDASLPVAPRAAVTVGAPAALDTSRYAAAVVIDSGLARAAALSRFAAEGGGVILSGDGLADRALAAVAPARVTGIRTAIPGGLLSPSPPSGLEAVRVVAVGDAIVLQRDADRTPAVVVLRRGTGRVLASVYRESWRWRMEGGADAVDAHRAWWAGLVRAVAYAPPAAAIDTAGGAGADAATLTDAAPYADLVARLGPPVAPPAAARASIPVPRERRYDALLLGLAFAVLLAEWASRRLRGAR